MFKPWLWLASSCLIGLTGSEAIAAEPTTVAETIHLLETDNRGLTTWHKETGREDPRGVFEIKDGVLRVSGDGNGYLATKEAYQNYRVVVEYRWGTMTNGGKYVRNSGLLLHATGPDGGAGGAWPSCIECQLAQGCAGDLIVIRGKDAVGEVIPVSIAAETEASPNGRRRRWHAGGELLTFPPTKGQLWWNRHDWDFAELLDTRGREDVESPLGEWTRVECIADGERLRVSINGRPVNECQRVHPTAGRIALQCEGFEIYFRNWELHPLDAASR